MHTIPPFHLHLWELIFMGKRNIIFPTLDYSILWELISMGKRNKIFPTLNYSIRTRLISIDYTLMYGKTLSFFPTTSIL